MRRDALLQLQAGCRTQRSHACAHACMQQLHAPTPALAMLPRRVRSAALSVSPAHFKALFNRGFSYDKVGVVRTAAHAPARHARCSARCSARCNALVPLQQPPCSHYLSVQQVSAQTPPRAPSTRAAAAAASACASAARPVRGRRRGLQRRAGGGPRQQLCVLQPRHNARPHGRLRRRGGRLQCRDPPGRRQRRLLPQQGLLAAQAGAAGQLSAPPARAARARAGACIQQRSAAAAAFDVRASSPAARRLRCCMPAAATCLPHRAGLRTRSTTTAPRLRSTPATAAPFTTAHSATTGWATPRRRWQTTARRWRSSPPTRRRCTTAAACWSGWGGACIACAGAASAACAC